jgi:hypothetical protein
MTFLFLIVRRFFYQSDNTHMEAQGEMIYSSYSFMTSALDEGEWSASRPGRALYPRRKDPQYPLYKRLGGPRAGLNTGVEEKSLASDGDRTSIAQPSSPYPDTILTDIPRLQW